MSFENIDEEQKAKKKFKKNYPKLHSFEKQIVDKGVDKYVNKFVKKLGYRKANWVPCVKFMLFILLILNIFACYARPDFLTQLVVVLSVFFLTDNDNINRDKFRVLPILILISMTYDFVWLFFIQNMNKEGASQEGGLESPVKSFAIQMSYIAFFYKVSFYFDKFIL